MWTPNLSFSFPSPLDIGSEKKIKEFTKHQKTTYQTSDAEEIQCRKKLKIRREKHKKNKLIRRFNIKYLNKKQKLNAVAEDHNVPITRYYDQAIPIESTYLDSIYSETKYLHPILGKMIHFKRLTCITHIFDLDEYEYTIEERRTIKIGKKRCHFYKFDELINHLENSGYEYAHQLQSYLTSLMNVSTTILDDTFQQYLGHARETTSPMLIKSYDEIIEEKKESQKLKKKKVLIFPSSDGDNVGIKQEIRAMPYFKITEKASSQSIAHNIMSLSHNSLMLDMLGFDHTKLSSEMEGFDVFNCQKTSNWVLFYITYIKFKMDDQANQFIFCKELMKLVDIDGDEIYGDMSMYKNRIEIANNIIYEVYFIFKEANLKLKNRKHLTR